MTDSLLSISLQAANAAAQAEEDESRLAGNPPTPLAVEPGAALANPEGYTPLGSVSTQTPTELAPHGPVPDVELSAAVLPSSASAVIPLEAGLGGAELLPEAGLSAVAATAVGDQMFAAVLSSPALDLPTDRPVPLSASDTSLAFTPDLQILPTAEPLPPAVSVVTQESGGGGGPVAPPPEPPPEPPPPPPPPPELEPFDGRWKIDQTPAAGDKTGGDVIWENPEHGQKSSTFFDVSFNQGSLKLEEGQQIRVFLDVYHQSADALPTTAQPQDWTYAVSGRDPHLPVVESAFNEDGQLVVTLQAAKDGVNLTGDVFRVEVHAVSDSDPEGHDQLVFDINDTIPAIDVSSGATIGTHWDAHDDLLISIEENPPETHGLSTLVALGDLVEAFELQQQQLDGPTSDLPVNLAIPDAMHGQSSDDQSSDEGQLVDAVVLDEPDQLPEDQLEHASDGVGLSLEDRGGLSDLWNRLS